MPITKQGGNYILNLLSQGGTVAASALWAGLATNVASTGIDQNSTLASITEPTGGGYQRKNILNTNAVVTDNVLDIATPIEWQASGTAMNGMNWWFIANVGPTNANDGLGTSKLIAYGALSTQPRNLAIGEKLQFDLTWTLSTA